MKRLNVGLLVWFCVPLMAMDIVELPEIELPDSTRTSKDNIIARATLTKKVTPETPFVQSTGYHRSMSIDAFVHVLHLKAFDVETMQVIEKVPIELFNKFIKKHKLQNYLHEDKKKSLVEMQSIRDDMFCEFLKVTQQEKEILNIKYIDRRNAYAQDKAGMKRRLRCQCYFLGALPVAVGWAITISTLYLLRTNC